MFFKSHEFQMLTHVAFFASLLLNYAWAYTTTESVSVIYCDASRAKVNVAGPITLL